MSDNNNISNNQVIQGDGENTKSNNQGQGGTRNNNPNGGWVNNWRNSGYYRRPNQGGRTHSNQKNNWSNFKVHKNDLSGLIYDYEKVEHQDIYVKTTKKILNHIGKKIDSTQDILRSLGANKRTDI